MAEDGGVYLKAEFDTSDVDKQIARLGAKLKSLEASLQTKTGKRNELATAMDSATAKAEDARLKVRELKAELDSAVVPSARSSITKELSKAENELRRAAAETDKLGAAFQKADADVQATNQKIRDTRTAIGSLEMGRDAYNTGLAQMRDDADIASQKMLELSQELAALQTQKAQMEAAGMGLGFAEYDKVVNRIREITKQQKAYNKEAEKTPGIISSAASATKSFGSRIAGLAKRVFVFSLVTRALRALREWLGKAIKANTEASSAIATLKAALLTLAQPLLNAVIPAFTAFVNILAKVVMTIASLLSSLFGTTLKGSIESARAMNKEADAIEATGGAAEDAAQKLASFDEINSLASDSGGGGGGGTTPDIGLDFSALEGFKIPDKIADFIDSFVLTVKDVVFDWQDLTGEQIAEKAIAGIAALCGAVAGFMIGGVPGAIKGALLGFALGLVIDSLVFDHDGKISKEELWSMIGIALGALTGGIIGFKAGGVKGAAMGALIGMTITGVFSSLLFDHDGKIGKNELSHMLAVALSAFTGGVIGFAVGGLPGMLLGASIGFGISLILEGIQLVRDKAAEDAFYKTEVGQFISDLKNKAQEIMDFNADVRVHINSLTGEIDERTQADFAMAQQLIDDIFTLDATDNKTAAEIDLIKEKITELNGLGLDGIQLSFNDTTQRVNETKQSVLETIESLKQQYQLEALRESYIEAYRTQYEETTKVKEANDSLTSAMGELETAQDGVKAASERLTQAQNEMSKAIADGTADPNGVGKALENFLKLRDNIDAAEESLKQAKLAEDAAKEAVELTAKALEDSLSVYDSAKAKVGELDSAIDDWVKTANEAAAAAKDDGKNLAKGVADGIKAEKGNTEETFVQTYKDMLKKARAAVGIASPSKETTNDGKNLMQGLANGIKNNQSTAVNAMKAAVNAVATIVETGLNNIIRKFNRTAMQINSNYATLGVKAPTLSTVSIPRLATGAVIPPNREFLAVLGDQRSGNNIEAPEALLRQMAQEAASTNTYLLQEILEAIRAGKVIMVDRTVLGKVTGSAMNDLARARG